MAVKAPLIDAEVLREFFDKCDMYLTPEFLNQLSSDLEWQHQQVQSGLPDWEGLWNWAPATRRLAPSTRKEFEKRLENVPSVLAAGDVSRALAIAQEMTERPKWLVDWMTYWIHVRDPERVWWSRWVYDSKSETGALVLLVDNPASLKGGELIPTYQALDSAARYLSVLLESQRDITLVSVEFRPTVVLALVYGVYMFTMASWKMTEEFTQVLPPFPVVIRMLLGVNRWGAK